MIGVGKIDSRGLAPRVRRIAEKCPLWKPAGFRETEHNGARPHRSGESSGKTCRTYGARIFYATVSRRFRAGLTLCRAYGAGARKHAGVLRARKTEERFFAALRMTSRVCNDPSGPLGPPVHVTG